jgi:hypothetical protein
MEIKLDWNVFGWHIELPDGRAARGRDGKHPKYFTSPDKALAWAERNRKAILAQVTVGVPNHDVA